MMNFQGEAGHVMSYANPWVPYPQYDGFFHRHHTAGWWWCGMNEQYGPTWGTGTVHRSFGSFSAHQYIYLHAAEGKVHRATTWAMSKYDGPGSDGYTGTLSWAKPAETTLMEKDGNTYIIPLKPANGAHIWVTKPEPNVNKGYGFKNDKEPSDDYFEVPHDKEGTAYMLWDKRHNIEYMVVMHDKIKADIEAYRMEHYPNSMPFPEHDDERFQTADYAMSSDPMPAKGYGDPQVSAGVRVSVDWDMDLPTNDPDDWKRAFLWNDEMPYVAYNQI